jgi:hypothetical protein
MIPQVLWAEAYSTTVHIMNHLLLSAFKVKKLPYEIMFSNKSSIIYSYPFAVKYYMHVPQEKPVARSKLSCRRIKYYVVGYMESSKIL